MASPVSWVQVEQGWNVVTAEGVPIGTVAQVAGARQDDIFHGLAVTAGASEQLRYVPGEQVGAIFPGEVTLTITALEAQALAAYHESPPQTKWLPGKPPLRRRISNWFQGKR
jgi:hypothetical protein